MSRKIPLIPLFMTPVIVCLTGLAFTAVLPGAWWVRTGPVLAEPASQQTARYYFFPWYDGDYMKDWLLAANPNGSGRNFSFDLSIAGTAKSAGDGFGLGEGAVPPGGTLSRQYPGEIGGPVVIGSLTGDEAVVSQRSLMGDSFEEVPATDQEQLSDHFYWTWYDQQTPGFTDWVLIANPSGSETVHAVISFINSDGAPVSAGADIAPGGTWTPTFPGKMGGPVEVKAFRPGGSWPADGMGVIASQRVLSGFGDAFNELPATPQTSLSNHYIWTWYDQQSPGFTDWVMLANPADTPVNYQISIGGVVMPASAANPGVIASHGRVTPTFPGVMDGPVEVTASGTGGGDGKVIASQRSLAGPSFEEVPGYDYGSLDSDYHWTWYDQQSAGVVNWVMIANPADAPVTYRLMIGGVTEPASAANPGVIPPHGRVTPTFSGAMGGPVEMLASGKVMASQRVMWNGYFNEVQGQVLSSVPGAPGAVDIAMQYLGVPYLYGGATPAGFDCSGLVMYVYAQLGISLPHSAAGQFSAGVPVDYSQLQPGDLVFFGNPISHVGIYVGGGNMIHAPYEGTVVQVAPVSSVGGYSGACRL